MKMVDMARIRKTHSKQMGGIRFKPAAVRHKVVLAVLNCHLAGPHVVEDALEALAGRAFKTIRSMADTSDTFEGMDAV